MIDQVIHSTCKDNDISVVKSQLNCLIDSLGLNHEYTIELSQYLDKLIYSELLK